MDLNNKVKKPLNDNPVAASQAAAQEAVKAETASPQVRRARAFLFQWSVGIMIIAFGILTFLVVTIPTFTIDLNITHGLQNISSPVFSELMIWIS